MGVLNFVPAFSIFLLLSGQVLLLPDQAYADCCTYCRCKFGCTCPGLGTCPTCRMGESDTSQSQTPIGVGTVDIRGVREPLPSTITKPDVTETLMTLLRGSRVAGNYFLKLLGNVEDGLKFACPSQDNSSAFNLAFQMEADKEK